MALTRKMLKAMGIEEDKIDQIIEEHAESVNALKAERDDYKSKAEQIEQLQTELRNEKAKAAKADEFENKYNTYKAEVENRQAKETKETAYKNLLKEIGISDKRIEKILKVSDLSGIEMTDGKIKNADELKTELRTEWSDFVTTTTTKGAEVSTPATTTDGKAWTKEEIYAKDERGRYKLSTADRQKALQHLTKTED